MVFIITTCPRLFMRRSGFLYKTNSVQSIIQTVLGYERLKDFGKNFLMTGVDGQN